MTTHEGFIVENHAITGTHGSSCTCEIRKDEKGLAAHLFCFESDDVDNFTMGGEEGIELVLELLLVDLIVEIVDV